MEGEDLLAFLPFHRGHSGGLLVGSFRLITQRGLANTQPSVLFLSLRRTCWCHVCLGICLEIMSIDRSGMDCWLFGDFSGHQNIFGGLWRWFYTETRAWGKRTLSSYCKIVVISYLQCSPSLSPKRKTTNEWKTTHCIWIRSPHTFQTLSGALDSAVLQAWQGPEWWGLRWEEPTCIGKGGFPLRQQLMNIC
jgi:hypothetical protein